MCCLLRLQRAEARAHRENLVKIFHFGVRFKIYILILLCMATPNNPSPPLQEGEFFCVGIVLLGTISGREVFRHPANPKAQSAKRTVTRTHMLPPGSERCADEMAAMVLKKTHTSTSATSGPPAICSTTLCASLQEWIAHGQVVALCAHFVHTAHAEAGILTQEYLSPDWLHSEAAKPT